MGQKQRKRSLFLQAVKILAGQKNLNKKKSLALTLCTNDFLA